MHLLPGYAIQRAISIPELLANRDKRQTRRQERLTRHSAPLASFVVVAPGPIRDNELTCRILNHGVAALLALTGQSTWIAGEQAALVSTSGPEGLSSTKAPAHDLKLATIGLEHSYPLGRPWDIDVLTPKEEILPRRHFALPARRYLLCEQNAANCVRGKAYMLSDLLTQMEALLHDADSHNTNQ